MSQDAPLSDKQQAAQRRDSMRLRMADPFFINNSSRAHEGRKTKGPSQCAWCRLPIAEAPLFRCRDLECRRGLPACRECILVVHEEHPTHWMEAWKEDRYWALTNLSSLGYIYQHGHGGAPCANPTTETSTMEMATRFGRTEMLCRGSSAGPRCLDEEDRQVRRKATYRKYRETHLQDRREKTRLRMAALRQRQTGAEREARLLRQRQAQAKYREKGKLDAPKKPTRKTKAIVAPVVLPKKRLKPTAPSVKARPVVLRAVSPFQDSGGIDYISLRSPYPPANDRPPTPPTPTPAGRQTRTPKSLAAIAGETPQFTAGGLTWTPLDL
ncbi:hypothetical protein B0H16DRAFT_1831637 [Mycena metata]|uniref:Uncharacterized protein n=1 Tax=Mycena metata TaxID=1033252 RepID=A0AAD7NBJ1_9AGAR|nr:hypothetical protein B0H16DRAFT_1831637 [Mycena metata]